MSDKGYDHYFKNLMGKWAYSILQDLNKDEALANTGRCCNDYNAGLRVSGLIHALKALRAGMLVEMGTVAAAITHREAHPKANYGLCVDGKKLMGLKLYQIDSRATYWIMARSIAEAAGLMLRYWEDVEGVNAADEMNDLLAIRRIPAVEAASLPYTDKNNGPLKTLLQAFDILRGHFLDDQDRELDPCEMVITCSDW